MHYRNMPMTVTHEDQTKVIRGASWDSTGKVEWVLFDGPETGPDDGCWTDADDVAALNADG